MQDKATLQWKMRISPQDKKMIAYAAKHFHMSQSRTIKTIAREVYQLIKAEKSAERTNQKELAPAA